MATRSSERPGLAEAARHVAEHATTIAKLEHKIVEMLADPDGRVREELRRQLSAALPARAFDAIVAGLERRGVIASDGDRVRKQSAPRPTVLGAEEKALLAQLEAAGVEPPRPKELPKAALDKLIAHKLVVKVKPDLVMHAAVVAKIRAKLVAFLDAHGTIDAQQWKDLTGASRKFTIPLAEYFDAEKLTLRVGDVRRPR